VRIEVAAGAVFIYKRLAEMRRKGKGHTVAWKGIMVR
jgi:hypothetical protein